MSDTSHRFPNREGQRVPDVSLRVSRNGEWATVTSADLFANKNIVVFSLPGAFTPTCSSTHLPRYN
jgi:peroxiredoxin